LKTYLSSNKPKGEHIGLFGEFAVYKNLWCCPSRTAGRAIDATRFQIFAGEANVRETGTAGSIYKDTLLYQYNEGYSMNHVIRHR